MFREGHEIKGRQETGKLKILKIVRRNFERRSISQIEKKLNLLLYCWKEKKAKYFTFYS